MAIADIVLEKVVYYVFIHIYLYSHLVEGTTFWLVGLNTIY